LASVATNKSETFSSIFSSLWWAKLPSTNGISPSSPQKEIHAFDLLARMQSDSRFNDMKKHFTPHSESIDEHKEFLIEYAEAWSFPSQEPEVIRRKFEEVVWLNTVMYGTCGWLSETEFRADFYLCVAFF
jgi:hypothetical protein